MAGNFFGGAFFGGGFFGASSAGVRGKGGKREVIVDLPKDRKHLGTDDFLKQQLKIRHPSSAFEDTSVPEPVKEQVIAAQEVRESEMRAEAARAIEDERKKLAIYNENMRILLMIAGSK